MSTRRQRMRDAWRRNGLQIKLAVLFVLLLTVYLIPDMFYSVYPGQAAVLWHRFGGGTDVDDVHGEGLRFKLPWDLAYIYDVRLQEVGEEFDVLSSDGLPVKVFVSVRYRLHPAGLGLLHKHIGQDYLQTLVFPEVGAHVRELIARYRPAELYTLRRGQIQQEILQQIRSQSLVQYLGDDLEEEFRAIHVEDVLIRSIVLPEKVEEAIKDKLAQEQRLLEYDYRLQKEEKERQRKEIEAEGIRRFQEIVAGGISERYLKWKGIDATLELARSPNAKVVVIGAGEDGLPIILGGLDTLPVPPVVVPEGTLPPSPPPATSGPQSAAPPQGTAPPIQVPPG